MNNKALGKIVMERRNLVERIASFAIMLLLSHGKRTHHSVASCYIHEIRELDDLTGFYFKGDFGQTMLGGNDVSIKYLNKEVFRIYYRARLDTANCSVQIFEEGPWVAAMKKLMRNYDKDWLIEHNKREEAERSQIKRDEVMQEKIKILHEEAKRLGLNLPPDETLPAI